MTAQVTARIAAVLFVAVAVFQVLVALGAPWGAVTQGGGMEGTLPPVGRGVAVVSAAIVVMMAAAVLARAGLGPLKSAPPLLVTVLAWLTLIYSALAVFVNIITPSWRERALWAPVCVVIFAAVLITMVKSRRRSEGTAS